MTVIVSTPAVREKFRAVITERLAVENWLTPKTVPRSKEELADLLGRHGITRGNTIVVARYGARSPAGFPAICTGDLLVSLLLYRSHSDIARWIGTIGDFQDDPPEKALVLGMMKPFYLKWAERIYQNLAGGRYRDGKTCKHLPDETTRNELAQMLGGGCALAVYVGHGRSRGWSGYRGFRWRHVNSFDQLRPTGTMISLSCSSLRQDRNESAPFGVQVVMAGRVCVFLGSVGPVKIRPLEQITKVLLDCISRPEVKRIDQLIMEVNRQIGDLDRPEVDSVWSSFRLIGNPLQAL